MSDRIHILKELRDRVAKATGPDREIDAEIARATGWTNVRLVPVWTSDEWAGDEPGYDPNDDSEFGPSTGITIPRYTASIDAAVTLVPDGAEYTLSTLYGIADFECPLNGGDNDLPFHVRRKDGNVVLAICQWRVEYEIATAEATEKAAGIA